MRRLHKQGAFSSANQYISRPTALEKQMTYNPTGYSQSQLEKPFSRADSVATSSAREEMPERPLAKRGQKHQILSKDGSAVTMDEIEASLDHMLRQSGIEQALCKYETSIRRIDEALCHTEASSRRIDEALCHIETSCFSINARTCSMQERLRQQAADIKSLYHLFSERRLQVVINAMETLRWKRLSGPGGHEASPEWDQHCEELYQEVKRHTVQSPLRVTPDPSELRAVIGLGRDFADEDAFITRDVVDLIRTNFAEICNVSFECSG
ncbi:unnamed protein product [Sympodiomycopsis kandeliae]